MTNRSDELPQIAASACERFISMQPEILSYLKDDFRQVKLRHRALDQEYRQKGLLLGLSRRW